MGNEGDLMRRRIRVSFEELVTQNKIQILNDKNKLERIDKYATMDSYLIIWMTWRLQIGGRRLSKNKKTG